MNDIALKAENVSKQYRLGTIGTGTLSQDLNRWFAKIRGKEDPFLKIGETNDRTSTGSSDFVWALKDINFEIKKGDVVGIIGRNGAGKSTLLKLLSKTTLPTTGKIKINGRIASLLEVGTGFHPELTGRDNIFLNGAILGMTKREIQSKFDEIVDFAGVARYVDTPVKRYSSGMYVRLAFAVAAHLDPDILIVDEVLAVGDSEFQKKAIGKMKSVSEEGGRTVLFVSHNMAAVKQLCNKGIFLINGTIKGMGDINSIIDLYTTNKAGQNNFIYSTSNKGTAFKTISLSNGIISTSEFADDEDIYIEMNVLVNVNNPRTVLAINFLDSDFNKIFFDELEITESGNYVAKIPKCFVLKGFYRINCFLYNPNIEFYDSKVDEISFNINSLPNKYSMYDGADCGRISSPIVWETNFAKL